MTAELSEPGHPGISAKNLFLDGLHPNAAGYETPASEPAPVPAEAAK